MFACAALLFRTPVQTEAVLAEYTSVAEKSQLNRLQRLAQQAWWKPGHPGWSIWPGVDDNWFNRLAHDSSHNGRLYLSAEVLPAPGSATLMPTSGPGNETGSFGGFAHLEEESQDPLSSGSGGGFGSLQGTFTITRCKSTISISRIARAVYMEVVQNCVYGELLLTFEVYSPAVEVIMFTVLICTDGLNVLHVPGQIQAVRSSMKSSRR